MKILANKIITDSAKKEWIISIPKEMIIDEFFAFFKVENETEEITYPAVQHKLLFEEKDNNYLITIPHELVAQNSISGTTTSWRFSGKTKDQFVSIHTDGPLPFNTFQLPKDLYDYHFEFPEAVLTLVAEPKKFSVQLNDLVLDETTAKLNFEVEADFELIELDAELVFARRVNPFLYLYFEQEQAFPVTISSEGKIEYTLQLAELDTDFLVDNSNNLDALLRFKNDWHVSKKEFIQANQAKKKQIDKKVFLKEKPFTSLESYVTGSSRLSFYFRKELQKEAQLAEYRETSEGFHFRFFFKDQLEAPRLVFKQRNKKFRTSEYTLKTEFMIKKKFQSYSLDLSKEQLYLLQTYQPNEDWDAFIRSDGKPDFPLFVPNQVSLESNYHAIHGGTYLVRPQKAALSNFSFQFRSGPSALGREVKKLVIFGSVSDAAFRTEPYFNPDANSFFEVDFVQKDTSFISTMTEKYPARMTLFSSADFSEITDSDRENAERDAEKNFFLKLRLSEPDYVLLDAFTDVTRPVLWFNQHAALTYSKTIETSQLADKMPFDRLLTHDNTEAYFEEWRKYAKEFLEQLKEFVPEERIILNKGGTTLNYLDANEKSVPYKNKMAIELKQYFWDRLNNFILSVIPNARVIDFESKKYTGSSNNPLGHSFATFEEAYYKDFLKEMIYLSETPKQ